MLEGERASQNVLARRSWPQYWNIDATLLYAAFAEWNGTLAFSSSTLPLSLNVTLEDGETQLGEKHFLFLLSWSLGSLPAGQGAV